MLRIDGCNVCEVELTIDDVFAIAKILKGHTIDYFCNGVLIMSIRLY